jgi:hypothetical protein
MILHPYEILEIFYCLFIDKYGLEWEKKRL